MPTRTRLQRVRLSEGGLYLTVESQKNDHKEEEYRPERRDWHLRHGLGVGDERQTRSCKQQQGLPRAEGLTAHNSGQQLGVTEFTLYDRERMVLG